MVRRIYVKAKPGAKAARLTRLEDELLPAKNKGSFDARFTVAVTERAVEGRANRAIEKALAEYFKVPPSRVRIVSGETSKEKVLEISL